MTALTMVVLLVGSMSLELESDGSGFFELPDSIWVSPGTVVAVAEGDTLDARAGVTGFRSGIFVDPPPPPGEPVRFEFQVLPIEIPSSVRLDIESAERIMADLHPDVLLSPIQEQGLYISGSKRIGFSVGDGGGLDQGTRISVEGMAAPGISVSGSVTDQDLSAGPYSSELVSQLDRIFFRVDGGSWRARLGDMEWVSGNEETGPMSWRRDVSGIDMEADLSDDLTVGGGYGTSGDSRNRIVFFTSEGVQGPYDITSGWEIVPGSEKVWLDGELMHRGATADYEMEYTAGLITFTPSRLIRKDQRVEITFFQRGDGFRKDLVYSSVMNSSGELEYGFRGIYIEDDRDSPLGFLLSEDAVDVLRNAGEDPSEAWIDGATEVGAGNGDYTRDSLGHFVYEGPYNGDWNVIFGRPPSGPGDYIYDSSLGGYLWVEEGKGTHFPRQYVQIPTGYRTGAVYADYRSSGISGGLEAAFSSRTGNLFNTEETTREGTCITGDLSWDFWESGPGITLGGRLVTSGYNPPGELEADSSLSAWFLPVNYSGKDHLAEIGIGGEKLRVTVAGRLMEHGGVIERYRLLSNPEIGNIGISLRSTFLRRMGTDQLSKGETTGLSISAIPMSGVLKPFAGLSGTGEFWADSLSGRVYTGNAGLVFERGTGKALLRVELQDDNRSGGGSAGPFNVWRTRLEGSGLSGSWRFRGSLEHSSTSYDQGGSLQADAIMASATGSYGSVWIETVYNGSGTVSRSLDVIYVWVGEGEGEYSYDPDTGLYYPDPDGDYIITYLPGSAGEVVTSASLETTLSVTGSGSGLNSALRISSSADDRTRALLLVGAFDESQEGGYTVDLSPWFRWEAGLLRRLSLSARLKNERISYSGAGLMEERSWSIEAAPELRPSSKVVIDLLARLFRREEELYSPRDTRGARIEVDPSLEFTPGAEAGLLVALETREEVISGLSRNMYEAGPHLSLAGGGWTSRGSVTAGYLPGEGQLPAWFFDGNDTGLSWRVSARIGRSISSGFNIRLFYWGRRPAENDWSHRAGLEGTVNF